MEIGFAVGGEPGSGGNHSALEYTSPVEGHINRLKTIKLQMYGRAAYPILRSRLLAAT
ncbi:MULTISPECIES: transposase [unclassified Mesorhizobium]|uniref:transposase n=1 Tax=unclassified Mesorhizobium TaxID=325217 RepID=UPI0018DD52A1|nr:MULTISPECIES: transposase [unclassified Mesorhizobium]WJI78340.1 hypothetical protein NLY37_28050 [Mesorhizobium sp. C395A]